jgi:hypothetical protein
MAAVPLAAQQTSGDSELQLQGTVSISTQKNGDTGGNSNDSGSVAVNLGRFFTDHQEIGVTAFGIFDPAGDLAGLGGPFYRYNFGTGKTVPYVGASVDLAFGKFAGGTTSGGGFATAEAGIRWFLARNSSFNLGAVYTYDLKEKKFQDQLQIMFGFSHFWKK